MIDNAVCYGVNPDKECRVWRMFCSLTFAYANDLVDDDPRVRRAGTVDLTLFAYPAVHPNSVWERLCIHVSSYHDRSFVIGLLHPYPFLHWTPQC